MHQETYPHNFNLNHGEKMNNLLKKWRKVQDLVIKMLKIEGWVEG